MWWLYLSHSLEPEEKQVSVNGFILDISQPIGPN